MSTYYRAQAQRCLALSRACSDRRHEAQLTFMANRYFARAGELERPILPPQHKCRHSTISGRSEPVSAQLEPSLRPINADIEDRNTENVRSMALQLLQPDRCPLGRALFLSRTPRPPPFSSINSTPAISIAVLIFSAVSSRPPNLPSTDSSRATVGSETPECCAKSAWDQPSRARAALT